MQTAESAKHAEKTQSLVPFDHVDDHKPHDARQLTGVSNPASEA